ncbi:MAG: sn-glycerol-3-phosphate ABC transporter ATP-binding protein UgpC [Burkholderiaceae bacterium]|jgi:sn-glycerol 3-phosphate transport system ATP-binding protein|nr:sn-glycerol-3-phosphate ABC transporter ATP-binding protein UgpC [Burkholderiaceae bacterium]
MATLELHHIAKFFGNTAALHPTSLDVPDGEFVVLVGPSGCGKTTLLRMIAGLESPSEGDILIGGKRVNDLEPSARDIAMVFQNYALYPHMKVRDNLTYGLRLRGASKDDIDRRVQWAAGLLGLSELLDRKPSALSGGQRQRVAMGRAIVREPQLFLFDEPLSNLDARLRNHMRVEIKQLHQRLKTTTVFVTHDQVEAMTLAQRVVVMNQGRIEQVGTPGEVYARPSSVFVAGFLGAPGMNLFDAELGEDGKTLHIAQAAPLRVDSALTAAPRALVVGIRPEAFVPDAQGAWQMDIVLREALGAETMLHGTIGAQPCVVRLAGDAPWQEGQRIGLRVPTDALHVFDRSSGARLSAPRDGSTISS